MAPQAISKACLRWCRCRPGKYTITVEAVGFRKLTSAAVEVGVASTTTLTFDLQLGSITETVTVQTKNSGIQAGDSQLSRAITMHDVEMLPQLERYPITLALFQPGVQVAGGDVVNSRLNGARGGSNVTTLDGIDAADPWSPALLWSLFSTTDSTQEFRMIRHAAKAQYGRNAGAQIEMVTRSGTNRWTGNISNHLRNTVLNANEFLCNSTGLPRPKFIQNTFGATAGGPVVKNHTFVFGSYQGRRLRQDLLRDRDVLTSTARDGIVQWRVPGSSIVRSFDIARNDPRGIGIDPQIAALIGMLPQPNNNGTARADGLNIAGYRFKVPLSCAWTSSLSGGSSISSKGQAILPIQLGRRQRDRRFQQQRFDFPRPTSRNSGTLDRRLFFWSRLDDRRANCERAAFRTSKQSTGSHSSAAPGAGSHHNLVDLTTEPRFAQDDRNSVLELTDYLSLVRGSHIIKIGSNWHFTGANRRNENGIHPNVHLARANGNLPPPTIGPVGSEISVADRTRFEDMYNHLLA